MEIYKIEATENTPLIDLNHSSHTLLFKGDSRPENVQQFYKPVLKWLEDYGKHVYFLKDLNDSSIDVQCNFKFEYFNTSSSKCLYMLLKKVNRLHAKGNNVLINWYYETEDEDMCEAGEDLSCLFNFDFKMIEIPIITVLGTVAETSNKEASFSA